MTRSRVMVASREDCNQVDKLQNNKVKSAGD